MSGIRGGRPRMGGHETLVRGPAPRPASSGPATAPAKKRVLFVCIGNSCRSQMAEAFARVYGADVMEPQSAGVAPAMLIAPTTRRVLQERNVRIDGQFPKALEAMLDQTFDIVVNMSGAKIALPGAKLVDWTVQDPIGQTDEIYRVVAAQIEGLVMRLVLELRTPR
ncbi:MAG TPA: hypothetical protein VMG40_05320 [Bryobacteraceae bacterium]|nr:hypothetical protein [Bryobacteraceae bacterium]